MELDAVDLKILKLLQQDGRLAHSAIGKIIGLTGPSIYARIQRMEKAGVILGYTAQINPDAVGQGLVAFMRVTVTTAAVNGDEAAFIAYVAQEPRILDCFDVDGEDSYILKVRTSSPQELRALVADLRAQPAVIKTITSIALLQIKDSGGIAVIDDAPTVSGTMEV
jgi:Lrp/AsnC family leucine-responsive transcriptional regulator